VKIKVAWFGKTKDRAIQALTSDYLKRLNYFSDAEAITLPDEPALLKYKEKSGTRSPHSIVLLDSRGKQLSSEQLAEFLDQHQNRSPHPLLFAIGPASGFTEQTRTTASFVLSLGKMTLSHELARVVLLEQLYRAFTILKGHPYHLGH
jgi:23S rRNA (pseudouridine1915-N3)-methyltransferase